MSSLKVNLFITQSHINYEPFFRMTLELQWWLDTMSRDCPANLNTLRLWGRLLLTLLWLESVPWPLRGGRLLQMVTHANANCRSRCVSKLQVGRGLSWVARNNLIPPGHMPSLFLWVLQKCHDQELHSFSSLCQNSLPSVFPIPRLSCVHPSGFLILTRTGLYVACSLKTCNKRVQHLVFLLDHNKGSRWVSTVFLPHCIWSISTVIGTW